MRNSLSSRWAIPLLDSTLRCIVLTANQCHQVVHTYLKRQKSLYIIMHTLTIHVYCVLHSQEYGRGKASDCRKHVQKLNMLRGEGEREIGTTLLGSQHPPEDYASTFSLDEAGRGDTRVSTHHISHTQHTHHTHTHTAGSSCSGSRQDEWWEQMVHFPWCPGLRWGEPYFLHTNVFWLKHGSGGWLLSYNWNNTSQQKS